MQDVPSYMMRYLREPELTQIWLVRLWPAVPLCLSVLYLILVFLAKNLKEMDGRKEPYEAKTSTDCLEHVLGCIQHHSIHPVHSLWTNP